jgi:predicted transcriptional regulator
MGTMTISVDDDVEKKFRTRAKKIYGERKGALGQAVREAMDLWVAEKDQQEIARSALALMETGHDLGTRKYRTRDDLHDRSAGTD